MGHSVGSWAQYEFSAWRFGERAGLQFPSTPANGPPAAVSNNTYSIEGCASMADSAGTLQCSTNGEQVWNSQGRLMPNGQLLSGNSSNAAQGPLLLQDPGHRRRYFLFTVDAALSFSVGLRYSIVDMAQNGGLGDVLLPNSLPVPGPTPNYVLTEALTGVRHANGTDYWVVVHGWQNNEFLSYRLLPSGLDPVPVRSQVGSAHGPVGPPATPYGRVSLRASPDGRRLAAGVPNQGVELFSFDNITGRVSNPRTIPVPLASGFSGYGLEFSADNNVLYATETSRLYQIDLFNNLSSVLLGADNYCFLQRGPDSRIYVARYQSRALGVIAFPNVVGLGCLFQPGGQDLGGRRSFYGLPNLPNQPARPTRIVPPRVLCAGTAATFRAEGFLVTGSNEEWDFGDPTTGPANYATGNPVSHRYARAGRYTVALTLATSLGVVRRTQEVMVGETPSVRLSPRDTLGCEEEGVWLSATPQPPGTVFRWQDGSADSTYRALRPGRYTLEVTTPAGCTARDSVLVSTRLCGLALPNIITPNGDAANQHFVLRGLHAPDWNVHIFSRWGQEVFRQEPYDNTWAAQGHPDGVYFYQLVHRTTGQRIKGWVEVRR
ncbi:gliding motility-associated C-terminal domain-containing protein [Hymenobacter humi]|uniref:Gliding motility-associated C-terminal domain-containing protein n=1 Tax=Hymenobacter humi TaxID=1411620 RepID=A0ABW2U7T6_9BACT